MGEGQEPVQAFSNLPEVVRPYIFMYGANEITFHPPVTRIVTLMQAVQDSEEAIRVECASLNGDLTTVQVQPQDTVKALIELLRTTLGMSSAVDLQVRDVGGILLEGTLEMRELCEP